MSNVPFAVGHVTDQPTDRPSSSPTVGVPVRGLRAEAVGAASNNNERESWLRNKCEMPNFAGKLWGRGPLGPGNAVALIRTLVPLDPSATPTLIHE